MGNRSKRAVDAASEVAAVKNLLDTFLETQDSGDLREKIRSLIPVVYRLRRLGSSLIPKELASSARDRIEHYFSTYPQTLIDGDELLVISGIGEWARRLRELRVQFGWWIYSGVTIKEIAEDDPDQLREISDLLGIVPTSIRPNQYVLIRSDQDLEAAYRWNRLNTIRKQKGGVKNKLLNYFRENAGKIISGEELRYLANDKKEWTRRTRELRTEDGWPVYTKMQGRPEIPVGAYLLEEDKQAPEHDRHILDDTRVEVLQRDNFKCTVPSCGWDRSQLAIGDPRKFLEIHHVEEHAKGGSNDASNLRTLCNVHHDSVHRGELSMIDGVWTKVMRKRT